MSSDRDLMVMGILVVSVFVSGCASLNSNDKSDVKSQVPVGENAWETPKNVNITDRLNPSYVEISSNKSLIWRNQNNFSVNISIENVDREFMVQPKESHIFKPASDFEYDIMKDGQTFDSGKVVLS